MKKTLLILLSAVLLLGALSGCGQIKGEDPFTAGNEIFTYQKIDPERTQLVVARTGNIPVEQFCHAFEEKNPDVQVIFVDITGGNSSYKPLIDWITGGVLPDVLVSASGFFDAELSLKYFENLSEKPIIRNYEAAALQRTAIDSNVYWLPGPSDISAMVYNKTLFEQYGWEVPATFDEFVALCDRIRADTNGEIEPWNPNAKYSNELTTAIEAFTYEELFGGAENRLWYNALLAGEATMSQHMKPYFDVVQTLIDHKLLREEHFSYSATTRGKEFADGKIAIINANVFIPNSDVYEFSLMPFPTTKGSLGYLCDSFSCFVGLPKKERTEALNDAIDRFLEFFSSAEGQASYIGSSMKISNIKGVALGQAEVLAALQPAVDAGHMFGLLDFQSLSGDRSLFYPHGLAADMTAGVLTAEEGLAAADAALERTADAAAEEPPETVAAVPESLTILETSFLFADAYRQAAGADIGLIANNEAFRGNMMRMFAGELTGEMLTVFKPRSFANDSALVKVSMTGRQLLDALNSPVGNERVADCVYAYSGLKCRVAPWNELGSKYLSVTLADGSALEPDKLYTAAFWAGTVAEEYITETLETYEGSWEDIMKAQLRPMETIAPPRDGRITLVWD